MGWNQPYSFDITEPEHVSIALFDILGLTPPPHTQRVQKKGTGTGRKQLSTSYYTTNAGVRTLCYFPLSSSIIAFKVLPVVINQLQAVYWKTIQKCSNSEQYTLVFST